MGHLIAPCRSSTTGPETNRARLRIFAVSSLRCILIRCIPPDLPGGNTHHEIVNIDSRLLPYAMRAVFGLQHVARHAVKLREYHVLRRRQRDSLASRLQREDLSCCPSRNVREP